MTPQEDKNQYTIQELIALRSIQSSGVYASKARSSALDKINPNRLKAVKFYSNCAMDAMDSFFKVSKNIRPHVQLELKQLVNSAIITIDATIKQYKD
jgi:hypothetical protein